MAIWRSASGLGSDNSLAVDPPLQLHLDPVLRHEIVAHLRAAAPNEGCGLLAARRTGDRGEIAIGTRFYPGTNLDAAPTRYTMDPAEVLRSFRDLAAHNWSLGAIVHSHPTTPPTPSSTDLREAFYPEALMLIVSFTTEPPAMRAWRLSRDSVASPAVRVDEAPILGTEGATCR